jgi:hypothetical protein
MDRISRHRNGDDEVEDQALIQAFSRFAEVFLSQLVSRLAENSHRAKEEGLDLRDLAVSDGIHAQVQAELICRLGFAMRVLQHPAKNQMSVMAEVLSDAVVEAGLNPQ